MNQPVLPNNLRGLDGFSDDAFIRLKQLIDLHVIPFSASTYWRKVRQGKFPAPESISDQISATRVGHVREWARRPSAYSSSPKSGGSLRGLSSRDITTIKAAQSAGKSEDEIGELAKELRLRRMGRKTQAKGR